MGINNIDSIRNNPRIIEKNAKSNSTKFYKAIESIEEIGSNSQMLTNIDDMRFKIGKLVEEGSLEQDDYEYQHLVSMLNQATDIQMKPNQSLEKTVDFYVTYNNFIDIHDRVCGDNNV